MDSDVLSRGGGNRTSSHNPGRSHWLVSHNRDVVPDSFLVSLVSAPPRSYEDYQFRGSGGAGSPGPEGDFDYDDDPDAAYYNNNYYADQPRRPQTAGATGFATGSGMRPAGTRPQTAAAARTRTQAIADTSPAVVVRQGRSVRDGPHREELPLSYVTIAQPGQQDFARRPDRVPRPPPATVAEAATGEVADMRQAAVAQRRHAVMTEIYRGEQELGISASGAVGGGIHTRLPLASEGDSELASWRRTMIHHELRRDNHALGVRPKVVSRRRLTPRAAAAAARRRQR